MGDRELRLQELQGDLNTRESSTLVIATVASAASLTLLGIAGLTTARINGLWILGVLFPIAGIGYRELTIFSIDRQQYLELVRLVATRRPIPSITSAEFWFKQIRRWGLRVLLLSPAALWVSSYPETLQLFEGRLKIPFAQFSFPGAMLVIVVSSIGLCFLEWKVKDEAADNLTKTFTQEAAGNIPYRVTRWLLVWAALVIVFLILASMHTP